MRRVVITGLGAVTPLGLNIAETWESMKNGISGADLITRFDATNFKTQFACEVKNFNPNDYIDRKEARRLDLYAQYGIVAADEAIKDSGLDLEKIDLDMAGVIWGSGIGGIKTFTDEVMGFVKNDGVPKFNPFFIPKMINNIASGHISMRHGLRGVNYTTVTACASSTHAIADALYHIQAGRANVVVAGGSEATISEAGVGGFNAMKAISTRNDDPKTASRPFDLDRDGFVMGEGAGALIVEEYEHAKARGAKIYAEIVGAGMNADAYHLTAPHPEGEGAAKTMNMAIKSAGLNPEDVDYVNVHGTSTPLGDVAEIKAIQKVFGDHAEKLSISSTKSMTGHLLGAAGAVEAIAAIMAIKDGVIPPTINHFTDDPNIPSNLDYTFNEAKKREVNVSLSNTFGFGGHNGTVVFKKL